MKKFLIYTNPYKDPERTVTNQVVQILKANGAEAIECDKFNQDGEKLPVEDAILLVLGGDGTILKAVRDLPGVNGPVIGINLGTLGFLSEIEPDNLESSLKRLINDDFKIERRMLLEGSVIEEDGTYSASVWSLNDVVLTRCHGLNILRFDIYVNDQLLHEYSADGMIIATPTGSTGYNLSAMGPIASPASEMIILTPVCPHSLGHRSVILSSQDEVRIVVPASKDGKPQEMEISFDGNNNRIVKTGESILVKKSNKYVNIARLSKDSFLDTLGRKMSEKR